VATLLIIDDSAASRDAIRKAIEPAEIFTRIIEAADGIQGLAMMLNEAVDVVLCDLEMPGFDGEKILSVKESSPGGENIPFLFITASENVERRARLLESGACDAISKPFHPADLVARLRHHLKNKRLQDELRVKNETLARLSTTDAVTGLRTRRYVSEVLSIEFLRARRYHSTLSVLMADLDHFKRINDDYGHLTGDAVLRGVSDMLLSIVRATDVAGRYGGEEIIVIVAQNNPNGVEKLAERWRADIESARFESASASGVELTISIGVASFTPDMLAPDDLIAAADAALYRAKDAGRNQVCVAADCR
jgi:two-component system cell cycle response regulator